MKQIDLTFLGEVALFCLGVAGLALSAYQEHVSGWLAAAIALFFLTLFIQLLLVRQRSDQLADEQRDAVETLKQEIATIVRSSQSFYDEGNALTAQSELKSRFGKAIVIKNVYAPFPSSDEAPYPLESALRISLFDTFFASRVGHTLIEIMPKDIVLSDRGKAYEARMIEATKVSDQVAGQDTTQVSKEYKLRSLERSFPLINFIVFYYEDSTREAFFGWGGFGGGSPSKVYSTTHADAVQMFDDLFNTLLLISGSLQDNRSLTFKLDRYLGFWIDVAIEFVTDESGNTQPIAKNCGVLNFLIDRNGRLFVRGIALKIIDGKLSGHIYSVFRSTSCEIKGNKVFVSHDTLREAFGDEPQSSGKTTYDFKHFRSVNAFRGKVISYRRNADRGRFLETVGTKITDMATEKALSEAWGDIAAVTGVIGTIAEQAIGKALQMFDQEGGSAP